MAEPDETLIPTPSDYVDAPAADDEMDEELIEEEYYEEEAVEEGDDYDDDEFFEEVVEDSESDEERGESKSGGSQESSEEFDDSTGPPPSGTDLIASENSQPPRTDLETDTDATVGGHTDFADFPPLQEETRSDPPAELPTFADFVSASTGSSDVPTNTTEEVARIIPTDDEENQQSLQFTVTDQGPATAASPSRVIPEIEKETSKSNPFWYWMIFFLVGALLGGGAYVGWYLVNEDRKDAPDLGEERSRAPTPSPTVGLTTAFDPIQGNCDFEDIQNPHVIDQCVCVGEIQIIAEDIRTRYESRKANFIPTIYEDFDDDIAACSPRNQALVWISSGNDFEFSYEERVERFAVAALYASLGGIDWELNNNWLGDDTVCMWEGVTCDQDEMVQILALSDNRLKGRLPPEIGLLKNMLQFSGARNEIEGPIPGSLFFIQGLQVVDLSLNTLTGPVPPAVGDAKQLRELNLEENSLSGRISQFVGDAEKLEILALGNNQLVGSIPINFFQLGSLTFLDVGGNQLTGSIPTEISDLHNLTTLTLGPNRFRGDIPSAIGNLTNLEYLIIRDVPELSGRLPVLYGRNLKGLVELTIAQTNVTGNIETDFGALPKLMRMDLSQNQLRGSIPIEFGNLSNLNVLDLGSNFLEGRIPVALGNLAKITVLSLNDNVLRGDVPIEFADLHELQSLRLEGNLLTGRVTEDICLLRNGNLSDFVVDCSFVENSIQGGLICNVPNCCSGCRTKFTRT